MEKAQIQAHLKELGLDGWLLYDFGGSNPIARSVAGLNVFASRRWFAWIPQSGNTVGLLPALEMSQFADISLNEKKTYRSWTELESLLKNLIPRQSKIAMEYSPHNAIPYISRVDAGTLEFVKSATGADVVSSSSLVQLFQSRWGKDGFTSHERATKIVYAEIENCIAYVREAVRARKTLTEFELQDRIMSALHAQGITSNEACIVSSGPRAGMPHYAPSREKNGEVLPDQVLLFDVWGKLKQAGSIYTDMTFMTYVGATPKPRVAEVWSALTRARDAGIAFVKDNFGKRVIRGFEVDDVVRGVVKGAGYGDYFIHRTGHSVQTEDHANGVNIDNFETHDEREIISDIGFSIEPGIYLPEFGMRTEIMMYIHPERGPMVTTPVQEKLIYIA